MSDESEIHQRRSGVLLHPTSLPGRWGIGDLGEAARDFVDRLQAARQRVWQILPLGPTGPGNSPYSTLSATAGSPWLISVEQLAREGRLEPPSPPLAESAAPLDAAAVARHKMPLLRAACERFMASPPEAFPQFCHEQSPWLDDYALFMALREARQGESWTRWPVELMTRREDALDQARRELRGEIQFHQFTQFVFDRQWAEVRSYAAERGIQIVGDIPFYVALDSSDVWSDVRNFAIDGETGEIEWIGGVPPDYFSATGQLWNVPVYDWEHLQATGFSWWVKRFRRLLQLVDVVRIDHFRGFAAYWQVPGGAADAVGGHWVEAPGAALFQRLREELGSLPIWAEDLGLITPDVTALRERFGFPGMKVLQFAFSDSGPDNPYLPFQFDRNSVCYTGTHDNDTACGWWSQLDEPTRKRVLLHVGPGGADEIHWGLIRLAMGSVANDVILPWQDVLGLGSEARMNVPGTAEGNWSWRFDADAVTERAVERLGELTYEHGR